MDDYQVERERMVKQQIKARGIKDKRVLKAMNSVPRHLFLPPDARKYAYGDSPIQIGSGQTISQPSLVAYLTELLELEEGNKVLEIGACSGY